MTDLVVVCRMGSVEAEARWKDKVFKAVIGRSGPIAAADKREGDGATPLGRYPLLLGFYRADRREKPGVGGVFPWHAVVKGEGFCDNPDDPMYNQLVPLGHPGSGGLWQDGTRHDVSLFIGYNVGPTVPGRGSAIMLHGMDKAFTAGCVAMDAKDLAGIADDFVYGDGVEIVMAHD